MGDKEDKKCPKCGGEMAKGKLWSYGGVRMGEVESSIGIMGDKIHSFYCKTCGYIELYKETKG